MPHARSVRPVREIRTQSKGRAGRRLAAVGFALGLAGAWPEARATCGSANCFLVTGTQEGAAPKGTIIVDLSYRYVDQSRKLFGSEEVGEVLAPKVDFEGGTLEPDHHREVRTQNTLVQVDLSYGLSERLTIAVSLPIVNQRDHEHWDEVGTPEEHFTRQDGTSGLGDARLGLRGPVLLRPRHQIVGGLSVKVPTGSYRLRDGEGGINEPTLQPGTGSIDLLASLHYAAQPGSGRWEAFVSGSHRRNGESPLDYRIGNETTLGLGVVRRAGPRLAWSLQVNARRAGRDRFLGAGVPSTGRREIDLTPGVRLGAPGGTSIYAHLQAPVRQRVNEAQLAPRTGLMIGVSRSF
jgi:hypothetical protein